MKQGLGFVLLSSLLFRQRFRIATLDPILILAASSFLTTKEALKK